MQMDVHKHFPLSTLRQQSQKMRFVDCSNQAYYDNLHKRLSADFKSRTLLFKEALPWSLRKPQMMTLFYVARLAVVTSKQEL